MGISGYRLKQRSQSNSVRFVTHKGHSLKINTTTNRGLKERRIAPWCITEGPWTPNHSKTTKFIQSKPVVEVKKGKEPSF